MRIPVPPQPSRDPPRTNLAIKILASSEVSVLQDLGAELDVTRANVKKR